MFWSLIAFALIGVYVAFALIAAKSLWFKSRDGDEDALSAFGPASLIRPDR